MKKGFVYPTADVVKVNPNWYYNWGPNPTPGVTVPFVPMVWGKNTSLPSSNNSVVLGFNEPDLACQSNLTPVQATSLWSAVKGTRIGSPATSENPVTGTWLKSFGGDYDFVCLHWYGPCNVTSFLHFVDSAWEQFKKPIWITEFAVADWSSRTVKSTRWTANDVHVFMTQVLPCLESRPYVERYSWKTRNTEDNSMWFSSIFNNDGTLTPLGEIYSLHV
jgi:hypothetical protein